MAGCISQCFCSDRVVHSYIYGFFDGPSPSHYTNRMRKLPQCIDQEFGKETLAMYRKLERIKLKSSDFKNHGRFSLRSFSKGVTPVSIKLKNNIRTHRSDCITCRAKKKLLNERIRNINNTIEHYEHEKYMYNNKLTSILGPEIFKQCEKYIYTVREARQLKVLEHQKYKFDKL